MRDSTARDDTQGHHGPAGPLIRPVGGVHDRDMADPPAATAGVTVRRVRTQDWPALRAIRLEMVADTPIAYSETVPTAEARTPEEWAERARLRAIGGELAQFVAVEPDGRLVATASAAATGPGTSVVVGVYVTPTHRGQGLLEALIAALAAWSREHGREQLTLEVAEQNPRAAAAYRRMGFVGTGRTRPHTLYPEVVDLELTRRAAP